MSFGDNWISSDQHIIRITKELDEYKRNLVNNIKAVKTEIFLSDGNCGFMVGILEGLDRAINLIDPNRIY